MSTHIIPLLEFFSYVSACFLNFGSHFIVDVWTSKLLDSMLKNPRMNKTEERLRGDAVNEVAAVGEREVIAPHIGPTLWSANRSSFYSNNATIQTNMQPQVESAEAVCPSSRRRVNQVTSSGRISATVLYQELSKFNVDAHRLVAPYDYGEVHGPAEHMVQPFRIEVHPQVGFLCDVHGHLCDAEVIGLLAGKWDPTEQCLYIQAPFPCAATERHQDHGLTDVELDTEAEWKVREAIAAMGLQVIGWYHSHPKFKPDPSVMDIFNQQQYQQFTRGDEAGPPFVGLIVSTFDTHLATAASHHQWFTVVPYSPPPPHRSNSIVEDDLATTIESAIHVDRKPQGGKAEQGTVYMPVRMDVSYCTVILESALPDSLRAAACSGFVDGNAAYSESLLQALQSLRVGPEGEVVVEEIPEPESKVRGLKSKKVASIAATEDKQTKEKATKPSAKTAVEVNGKAKESTAPPLTVKNGRKSSANTSIVPPAPISSDGESGVTNSLAGSCDELTPVPLTDLNLGGAVEEAGPPSTVLEFYDRAYERDSENMATNANFVTSLVISLDKAPPKPTAELEAVLPPTVAASAFEGPTSVADSGDAAPLALATLSVIVPVPVLSDADLARQISAEDQATQQGRRPSRGVKSREKYGDFVDTVTALKGQSLRKQDMKKVKEKELKEKLAAKKARIAADKVASSSPVAKGTVGAGTFNERKPSKAAIATGKGDGKRPKCDDCVAPLPTDPTLCAEITTAAKGGKAGVKVEGKKRPRSTAGTDTDAKSSAAESTGETSGTPTVFTSLIFALQDTTRPCAALARSMLCTVVPPYRGLVLVVITMGFYYSRAPRRVDITKEWRGQDKVTLSKIDKLKASAQVWLERLGIQRDCHKLTELLGQFIGACWEDYAKTSKKRKIS